MRTRSFGTWVSTTTVALAACAISIGAGCGSTESDASGTPVEHDTTAAENDGPGGTANNGSTSSGQPGTTPAGPTLVQTPGTYGASCDGSGGVSIDATHFLAFNDENQILRIY